TKRANKDGKYQEKESKDIGNALDPEAEPLSWGWVCARVADMLTHNPHGLTECVMLNKLLSEWQEMSVEYRKGVPKVFAPFRTIHPRFNTKIRDYELIVKDIKRYTHQFTLSDNSDCSTVNMYIPPRLFRFITDGYFPELFNQKNRRIRFNRASLSKTAPKLTFLNTGNILIMLTQSDEEFIDKLFTDSFLDITLGDISNGRGYQFWMRVVHVGPKEPANFVGFSNKVCVYVRDMLSTRCATLVLLDDKIRITNLFKTGDFLGIHWPYIEPESGNQGGIILHYCDSTVLFCLPMNDLCKTKHNPKSKFNYHDDSHMIDYKYHHERFFINKLPPRGLNVTLYGKLESISENDPSMSNEGKQVDRYAIKLSDRTGCVSITLWGRVGREVSQFHIGQYIVLEGLRAWRKFDGTMEVNGDVSIGTVIYNVSMAEGWLAISSLRGNSLPLDIIIKHSNESYLDQFVCRCLITDWAISDKSSAIKWCLDDGTGVIWVEAAGSISQDILHSIGIEVITERSMRAKLTKEQLGHNIKGKMLWCCISVLGTGKYQFNSVLMDYSDGSRSLAQADCHKMLKELQQSKCEHR
ncbi:10769_t:CDS:10, partial [Acaulospora morrowiae]